MSEGAPLNWLTDDQRVKQKPSVSDQSDGNDLDLLDSLGWSASSLTAQPFSIASDPGESFSSSFMLAKWGQWDHPKHEEDLGWVVILFIQPHLEHVGGFQNLLLNAAGDVQSF